MESAITKSMYVRKLTEKEYEAVKKKSVKEIKRITGIGRDFMMGDSMVAFADKPIKWGLYKVEWKKGKDNLLHCAECFHKGQGILLFGILNIWKG